MIDFLIFSATGYQKLTDVQIKEIAISKERMLATSNTPTTLESELRLKLSMQNSIK